MLTNPYVIALGIPLVLIVCGSVARKLVRGTSWKQADFYLGVELALAALASALVYMFDLAKLSIAPDASHVVPKQIAATATFLAISFFLLLWILATHQEWEKRAQNPKWQAFWLIGVMNLAGAILMACFVLWVKGL